MTLDTLKTGAASGAFAILDTFSIIDVNGLDAVNFLHNQLSNDIQHLDDAHMRRAGLCSPKGRLLASFLVWKTINAVQLMVSADVRTSVRQHLAMFVLRSKVKLIDAHARLVCVGLAGDVCRCLAPLFPTLPDNADGKVENEAGVLIRLTDSPETAAQRFFSTSAPHQAARARILWVAPRSALNAHLYALDTELTRIDPAAWDWLTLQTGEPWITAATQAQFVPQMINFELIGGVNFHKGCYPGQEIVARTHYRGTLKRRMMLAHTADAQIQAGAFVFHSLDSGQPCGTVVNAAPAPGGGSDCLVELKLAALNCGTIHFPALDGPALSLRALPYAVPEVKSFFPFSLLEKRNQKLTF